ncbi:hypothetical protein [Streptomyces sp. NPDC002490]|uniref:hypothetical protein n=1 Tax=Streptomyces sp. NPDC002490 TaxID=3154416 RepID=UPI00331C1090
MPHQPNLHHLVPHGSPVIYVDRDPARRAAPDEVADISRVPLRDVLPLRPRRVLSACSAVPRYQVQPSGTGCFGGGTALKTGRFMGGPLEGRVDFGEGQGPRNEIGRVTK